MSFPSQQMFRTEGKKRVRALKCSLIECSIYMWSPVNLQSVLLQLITHWVHVFVDLSLKKGQSLEIDLCFSREFWPKWKPTKNQQSQKVKEFWFLKEEKHIRNTSSCDTLLQIKFKFSSHKEKEHETLSDAAAVLPFFKKRDASLNWGLTVGYWLSSEPWTSRSPHLSLTISEV